MALQARGREAEHAGLLASVRKMGAALVALLHTRVELFAREFEVERTRLLRVALFGLVALFFFALGALTLTLFVIVLFWDTHRVLAAGALTLLYFAIAAAFVLSAKREAARMTSAFERSIAELKKDRERFSSHG